jgi:hypothetical protein
MRWFPLALGAAALTAAGPALAQAGDAPLAPEEPGSPPLPAATTPPAPPQAPPAASPPRASPPPAASSPATPPAAPIAGDTGLTLGLRLGYAAPFGRAKSTLLSDVVDRSIPLGVGVGWFFGHTFYVGAVFAYGFAHNATSATSTCPNLADVSCSAHELRFGLEAEAHLAPTRRLDPWIGLGVGYEILDLTAVDATGNAVESAALHGVRFLDASIGLDWKPAPWLGVGPFVGLALGHYASDTAPATTTHGFATVGLRVRSGT